MKHFFHILFILLTCQQGYAQTAGQPSVQILGVAQDGGYPHMGCTKKCCEMAWKSDSMRKFVVSLAIVDPVSKKWWLVEATPDIKYQLQYFKTLSNGEYPYLPAGILITHAHIGHYTGLMELGREVMNTKDVPVYVLPKLAEFLQTNGPWSQLVKLNNIVIHKIKEDSAFSLSENVNISAFRVPHRDEYSETAGFRIAAGNKKYLFIPDIDKWEKWNRNIVKEVESVDYALLDATFNEITELPNRKIGEVPHPLVTETMGLFTTESTVNKHKIYFIHMNHTNPLLWDQNVQNSVEKKGFNFAKQGMKL